MKKGPIIYLNGVTSSGKSSIAARRSVPVRSPQNCINKKRILRRSASQDDREKRKACVSF